MMVLLHISQEVKKLKNVTEVIRYDAKLPIGVTPPPPPRWIICRQVQVLA